MEIRIKSHRWVQLAGFTVLLAVIWEGAGATLDTVWRPAFLKMPWPPMTSEVRQFTPSLRTAPTVPTLRVRFFAGRRVRFLTVQAEKGLEVNNRRLSGAVSLVAQNGKISLTHKRQVLARSTSFTIRPMRNEMLQLHLSRTHTRLTRGELRVTMYHNQLIIVNSLDLEDYLPGIVEPELGSLHIKPDAMKAQMIAGRSYLLAMGMRHGREGYEFCDAPHCQVFRGIVRNAPLLEKAAQETRGMYLTFHGRPVSAFYHHSCGGATADSSDVWPGQRRAYLIRHKDGTPAYCRKDSRFRWSTTRSIASLRGAMTYYGWLKSKDPLESLRVYDADMYGRARKILILGGDRRIVMSANAFRRNINRFYGKEILLSTFFSITRGDKSYTFDGRGWGHGVGLCQEGALEMARRGKTYPQILAHYYPGTRLSRLASDSR